VAYNFSTFKAKASETENWLKKELSVIRTGRATPIILDAVKVESYGSFMPINQLASIVIEDPRTIRITPWDMTQVKSIEKGITDSGLGLSVNADDKGLRVIFPELTSERRQALTKIVKQKLEDSRISLRKERDETKSEIEKAEKDGKIAEDDKFRALDDLQKIVDETNKKLDELAGRKEKEISE